MASHQGTRVLTLTMFLIQGGYAARVVANATDANVEGGARWQAQVNQLCDSGSGGGDVQWDLADHNGDGSFCSCECSAEECMTEECPEGYEEEDEECARYESIAGEYIPPIEEPVTCDMGTLQVRGGRATCFVEQACPPPPPANGQGVVLALAKESCGCEYVVTCEEPAELIVRGGVPICHTAAVKHADTHKRVTVPLSKKCPDPTDELVGGVCQHKLEECPVLLQLDKKAIACGPGTDAYIERMLTEMKQQALTLKSEGSSSTRASCMMTCHAVFAKFSECAKQNSGPQCAGRAARSGKAVRPIGAFAEKDRHTGSPGWLKKLKKGAFSKDMPCKDMYGSEYNFKSGWLSGVDKIEKMAAKHYVILSGEYVDQPMGRLDCRNSYCGKADSYAKRQNTDRSCSACLAQCAEQYP